MLSDNIPLKIRIKHLFTSVKEPTTDKNLQTNKVQLEESMSFIRITLEDYGEGLLTGAEMIERQLQSKSLL